MDELRLAARAISEMVWDDIARRRLAGRRAIPQQIREDLWFAAEPEPRCYLCGYRSARRLATAYSDAMGAGWLMSSQCWSTSRGHADSTPATCRSRWTTSHRWPGGATAAFNLRLACGWCNRVKSDRSSLYDAPARSQTVVTTRDLGDVAVPQPLWVLRIVATRGRCEDPTGCPARLDTHELFIAARSPSVTITPVNALVFCSNHDPWASARYVGSTSLARRKLKAHGSFGSRAAMHQAVA